MYAKVGSKFCLTLNKPSTICQRLIKNCQSGEVSSNLVTLMKTHTHKNDAGAKFIC